MRLVTKALPQTAVDVMVLSDSHIGSKWFNTEKWQYAIDLARKTKMRVLFDGDLLDVATITSKTPPWDQAMNLHDAMAYARNSLEPIATQIDGAVGGNHGARLYRFAGVDPEQEVWEQMQVPYMDASGVMQYRLGTHNAVAGDRGTFSIYMHHTASAGRLAGVGLTAVERLMTLYEGADVYVGGHAHKLDAGVVSRSRMHGGAKGDHITEDVVWLACCGSFLNWSGSYGERSALSPSPIGYVIVHLERKGGQYRADSYPL
jgi:hypothetical protein